MSSRDDWDDGRTIADMSGVERRPFLIPAPLKAELRRRRAASENREDGEAPKPPRQQSELDPADRRAAIGGALTATLAIALVFLICGALLIWLMTAVWR